MEEILKPKTCTLSEIVKPDSRRVGSSGAVVPIGIIRLFSKLHFKPLKLAKEARVFLIANRERLLAKVKIVESSAKASVLPVCLLDSDRKRCSPLGL